MCQLFDIVRIENRFIKPTSLGWSDVQLIVKLPLKTDDNNNDNNEDDEKGDTVNSSGDNYDYHYGEIQLQHIDMTLARKKAHSYYKVIRNLIQKEFASQTSSIVLSYITDKFADIADPTKTRPIIWNDEYTMPVSVNSNNSNVNNGIIMSTVSVVDITEYEWDDKRRPKTYNGCDVVAIVYSAVYQSSWDKIKDKWLPEAIESAGKDVKIVIIELDRFVPRIKKMDQSIVETYCKENGYTFKVVDLFADVSSVIELIKYVAMCPVVKSNKKVTAVIEKEVETDADQPDGNVSGCACNIL